MARGGSPGSAEPTGDARPRIPPPLEERAGVLWYRDIAFVPSIHGRVAFARETRRVFLGGRFPAVAVELPESLAERTLEGLERLPLITVVSYEEPGGSHAYFPIDPCDSIVEALRLGTGEHASLEFIDRDVEEFARLDVTLPDPYAVDSIGLPLFYAAVEPSLPPTASGSQDDARELHMARRLWKLLQADRRRLPILCVLGMSHLRGVARYLEELARGELEAADPGPLPVPPLAVALHALTEGSLYHVLGELPYTTYLYELERRAITLEEFEAVAKLKEMLLTARERYHAKHTEEYERISLSAFQNLLTLTRNLCLLERRLTPSLYEIAVAAKGIAGSEFAIQVIEAAKRYPFQGAGESAAGNGEESPGAPEAGGGREQTGAGKEEEEEQQQQQRKRDAAANRDLGSPPGNDERIAMTEDAMGFGGEVRPAKKRYLDIAKVWKKLKLEPPPPPAEKERWRTAWNPSLTCSWTPEDVLIENFAGHVRARALLESGLVQERLEEFRTSFKDGIHVRETIRNLHLGKVIVKEAPPPRGQVGAVVVIYELPDPRKFPWKLTWLPEYEWESLLAFYASDYTQDLIGPGIARATYGGQLFLRGHRWRGDVWSDPDFDEARDEVERLVFAGAAHSPEAFVAYVAAAPPTFRMKEYARRVRKRLIYLPLSSFSRTTLQRLRRFHVLNGKPVRSYARQYIR